MSARVLSAPAPTTQASVSRTTTFIAQVVGTPPTDLSSACVAWGQSVSAPATYGGLTHPHQLPLANANQVALNYATNRLDFTLSGVNVADEVVGDRLWLCYFSSIGTAISGSVPDAVDDLGLVVD